MVGLHLLLEGLVDLAVAVVVDCSVIWIRLRLEVQNVFRVRFEQ